jgi:hypothetical protein
MNTAIWANSCGSRFCDSEKNPVDKKHPLAVGDLKQHIPMAQQIERNQDATIYVGNLDERCTETLVWELMLQAGPVGKYICKIRLLMIRSTNANTTMLRANV